MFCSKGFSNRRKLDVSSRAAGPAGPAVGWATAAATLSTVRRGTGSHYLTRCFQLLLRVVACSSAALQAEGGVFNFTCRSVGMTKLS